MKPLSQVWINAQEVAAGAMRRADTDVLGTERARMRYQKMTPEVRTAMEQEVIVRFGKSSWDEFMTAIGEKNGNKV